VRELRNVLIAAHAQSAGGLIEVAEFLSSRSARIDLGDVHASQTLFSVGKREVLDAFERDYFGRLHRETRGNLSEMARRSGLSRPTVREYLERHALRSQE
jgi:transcriptional regulator of acetoin/glycerol metabolism